jgi:hypothetical protein
MDHLPIGYGCDSYRPWRQLDSCNNSHASEKSDGAAFRCSLRLPLASRYGRGCIYDCAVSVWCALPAVHAIATSSLRACPASSWQLAGSLSWVPATQALDLTWGRFPGLCSSAAHSLEWSHLWLGLLHEEYCPTTNWLRLRPGPVTDTWALALGMTLE